MAQQSLSAWVYWLSHTEGLYLSSDGVGMCASTGWEKAHVQVFVSRFIPSVI